MSDCFQHKNLIELICGINFSLLVSQSVRLAIIYSTSLSYFCSADDKTVHIMCCLIISSSHLQNGEEQKLSAEHGYLFGHKWELTMKSRIFSFSLHHIFTIYRLSKVPVYLTVHLISSEYNLRLTFFLLI